MFSPIYPLSFLPSPQSSIPQPSQLPHPSHRPQNNTLTMIQVFKALQSAYISLLQNPFFDPDEHTPPDGRGGKKITSRKFGAEVRRIGEAWYPGVSVI